MQKFDSSCGISKKEIDIIKFNIKRNIELQLPVLPESIGTKLFLQGRDAWIFSWCLLNEKFPIPSSETISLEVVAKLKREFHQYIDKTNYNFTCNVKMKKKDLYHPKVSIIKNFA